VKVELLWIDECPSYQRAKELLEQILRGENIAAAIEMIQVRGDADAVAKQFLGSPTIRINNVDPFAEPNQNNFAMQCRVYRTPEGLKGVPTKEMLRTAVMTPTSILPRSRQGRKD